MPPHVTRPAARRGVYYEDLLDLVHQDSKRGGTPALLAVVQGKYRTMTRKHPTNRLETNLVAVPYKKPGVLAWPDFFTALRNWGFTVQEHRWARAMVVAMVVAMVAVAMVKPRYAPVNPQPR